jgi:hypothetical protein
MIIEEAERIIAERNILIARHEITLDTIFPPMQIQHRQCKSRVLHLHHRRKM